MWGRWKEGNLNSSLQVPERRGQPWAPVDVVVGGGVAGSTGLIQRSSPKALQLQPMLAWLWGLQGAQLGPPYLASSPSQTQRPRPCPILQMGELRLRASDSQG